MFIFVVVVLNPVLKGREASRGGLTGDELGVVYAMLLAAVSVPTYGVTGYVILSRVGFALLFCDKLRMAGASLYTSMYPCGRCPGGGRAVAWFFEGLPPGAEIPWEVWIMPLFWWGSVIVATLALCTCLIAIFRKQWVDKERLNFSPG